METYVKIKSGKYRGNTIKNAIFPLIKDVTFGKKGMFLTVDATQVLGPKYPSARIIVNDITAFEKVSEHEYNAQDIVQKKYSC